MPNEQKQEQQVMAVFRDKGGKIAKHFAEQGNKVYAYHPSHKHETDVDVHQNGGAVIRYGNPLDETLNVIRIANEGRPVQLMFTGSKDAHEVYEWANKNGHYITFSHVLEFN